MPPVTRIPLAENARLVLAGSVGSSERILRRLVENQLNVVGVLGLAQDASQRVSGYSHLATIAADHGLPYRDFIRINDPEVVAQVAAWAPDLFFVVGLSQIVRPALLTKPAIGCVGFHPTRLPRGRGRAPIAWLALEPQMAAATLFLMDEGADSGPVVAQHPFAVPPGAYASDVLELLDEAIDGAVAEIAQQIRNKEIVALEQDGGAATWYGKRGPEDGRIDWAVSAEEICALVRATSHPHPGAFTYLGSQRLRVWGATVSDWPGRGVVGRIVEQLESGLVVQAGTGSVLISDFTVEAPTGLPPLEPRVGSKLGIDAEFEIILLKEQLRDLEASVRRMEALIEQGGGQL